MLFRLEINKDVPEEVLIRAHGRTPLVEEIERLVLQENMTDQIPGYLADEIRKLSFQEIVCFVVEGERTVAVYQDRKKYQIKKRLYELEEMLPSYFERISKSAIANWQKIGRFRVQIAGAVDAVFDNGYTECISRRCFAELKRRYGL